MTTELSIVYRSVEEITPRENNPRRHPDEQIQELIGSIERHGFTQPILIDENDVILAGHARLEAASLCGLEQVPTITIGDWDEATKREYVIVDNQMGAKSTWDFDALYRELNDLDALDRDLSALGFTERQLEAYMRPGGTDEEFGGEERDGDTDAGKKSASRTDEGFSAFECVMEHQNKLRLLAIINKIRAEHKMESIEDALMLMVRWTEDYLSEEPA